MNDDEHKQKKDDFADDFSDDFGDDFSDELSEDNVGFEDDKFDDETVVYDEDMDSGSAGSLLQQENSLAEYKKYIVMAFSITLTIVFFVIMLGKKKKPADDMLPNTIPAASQQIAKHQAKPEVVSDLDKLKGMPTTSVPTSVPLPASTVHTSTASNEDFNKIYQETKLMSERLNDFQTQFQSNRSSFSQLSTTLSTLERSIRQANSSLGELNDKLVNIKTELKKQQTAIKKIQQDAPREVGRTYSSNQRLERVGPPAYTLYAAIPGRAWLKSQAGATLTVAMGSNVPGYGRITLIEPIKGMVVTNKGYIFKFADH